MNGKERNLFIDVVKGLAIFLMLWGHCIQYCLSGTELDFFENGVFRCIYSFHMPLFMLVSGYLFYFSFAKRDLWELVKYRTQSLLQPIVLCTLFNYLITTVLVNLLRGNFILIFDGRWLQNLPSLWFLWSVLAASLAVALICKKVKTLWARILLLFAAIPVIAVLPNATLNLYMYPYFVLGFFYAKYRDRIPSFAEKIKYLALPLFPVMLCFYEKKHYIYTTGLLPSGDYSLGQMLVIDGFRWLIGLVGSIFVITLLQLVYRGITSKFKKPFIRLGLSCLGKKSLQIYVFSVPFLSFYLPFVFPRALAVLNIGNIFAENMLIYNFVFTLFIAICYAFALYWVVKLFEKMKFTKVLFGK